MYTRKGQITLFVIIGILIIVVVALIFFLRKPSTGEEAEAQVKVDLELIPIQSFVTNCLYYVGKEGVIRLGAHGGFIQPDQFGIFANPVMPTESN